MRFAGDYVDDILLHQLLEKGRLDPGTTLGKQVQASVRLSGLRRIKERLFIEHRIDVPLTHDVVVSIEESEFLSSSDIRNFETQLHSHVKTFLESTDPEHRATTRHHHPGSDRWRSRPSDGGVVGAAVLGSPRCDRWLPRCPQSAASHFNKGTAIHSAGNIRSSPSPLAALCSNILDERNAIVEWAGGAPTPGALDRVQTGGI